MVVALAFVIPTTVHSIAMALGATLAHLWSKRNPSGFADFGYPVAAGLLAGEGMGGVANAVLQIFGLSGAGYGISLGCPPGAC